MRESKSKRSNPPLSLSLCTNFCLGICNLTVANTFLSLNITAALQVLQLHSITRYTYTYIRVRIEREGERERGGIGRYSAGPAIVEAMRIRKRFPPPSDPQLNPSVAAVQHLVRESPLLQPLSAAMACCSPSPSDPPNPTPPDHPAPIRIPNPRWVFSGCDSCQRKMEQKVN